MSTKLVILLAGGLPLARTLITNFVLSLFSGLDMLYIYIIYIHIALHASVIRRDALRTFGSLHVWAIRPLIRAVCRTNRQSRQSPH